MEPGNSLYKSKFGRKIKNEHMFGNKTESLTGASKGCDLQSKLREKFVTWILQQRETLPLDH